VSAPVVRRLEDGERAWLTDTIRERWPHPLYVGRGRIVDPAELSVLVAEVGAERVGLLTFVQNGDTADVVTLDALVPGLGAARLLLDALPDHVAATVERLRLMVTNDNLDGLRRYQQAGFRLHELRVRAIDRVREREPWMPVVGRDGIPVRDEVELVRGLPG